MPDREKLERRHINDPDKDNYIVRCIKPDGQPNCSMCHGPFYYCTKDHRMIKDTESKYHTVGCNRGKVKK